MDGSERILTDAYRDHTTLHPVAFAVVVLCGVLTIALPRRYAVLPAIVLACFIPTAQRLVVLSLDFTLLRLVVLAGWARLLIYNEFAGMRWTLLDRLLLAWAAAGTIAYVIQRGDTGALIYKLGTTFDAVGLYFLFRLTIRSLADVERIAIGIAIISAPTACAFTIEYFTAHNIFAVFGGVPGTTIVREGRLRCQGAFDNPILAGCFWAAMAPYIGAQYVKGAGARLPALVGLVSCGVIILACASSTPVMALLFGLIGGAIFPFRRSMRLVRWGVVILLIVLQVAMNKPLWHLMARVNVVGGSTGRHRFRLLDGAINNFSDWWLVGTTSTGRWGEQLFDVTNHYVLEGVRGGIVTLALFVAVIAVAFAAVGHVMKFADAKRWPKPVVWSLGVALFVHAMSFLSVSYTGQILLAWYLNLAMIGSMAAACMTATPALAEQTDTRRATPGRSGRVANAPLRRLLPNQTGE